MADSASWIFYVTKLDLLLGCRSFLSVFALQIYTRMRANTIIISLRVRCVVLCVCGVDPAPDCLPGLAFLQFHGPQDRLHDAVNALRSNLGHQWADAGRDSGIDWAMGRGRRVVLVGGQGMCVQRLQVG